MKPFANNSFAALRYSVANMVCCGIDFRDIGVAFIKRTEYTRA